MLRDRGVLERVGDEVLVTGDLTRLRGARDAARAHRVATRRRPRGRTPAAPGRVRARQDVLRARSRRTLGAPEDDVDRLVASLVRKELLAVETDPFSPERGQLGFLQALVQRVTYETIARRDRRARHLAAATYLASDAGIDPDEIAEVIATHYLDAHEADESAADAHEVRAEARRWFTRAADRAASLAASLEAQKAFERAADLDRRGRRAWTLPRARRRARSDGRTDGRGRVTARGGDRASSSAGDRRGEAASLRQRSARSSSSPGGSRMPLRRWSSALASHEAADDEAAIATVSAQLGRFLFFEGTSRRGDTAHRAGARARRAAPALRRRGRGTQHQGAAPPAPTEREPRADAPGPRPGRGDDNPRGACVRT